MSPPRPNIVLVIVHDLGRHLGCYGVEAVNSPNCDRLAAEGIRFAESLTVAPQCSPSRATLFTGRYPHENGMLGLAHDPHGWDLNPGERHLASYLGEGGYHTGLIGFQHETHRPETVGFHDFDYRWHDSAENISRDAAAWIERRAGAVAAASDPPAGAASDRRADEAGGGRRPFYLQLGIVEPHRHFDLFGGVPDDSRGVWVPPYLEDEPSARDDFAAYQGAIRKMDASVGTIIEAVRRSADAENTLLIFTTDHGIPFPRAKCSLYDPGLETALLAHWPAGGWTGGRVVDGMVSHIDVMPTLLELAGVELTHAERQRLGGESFADLQPRRDVLYGEMTWHDYYDPMRCVRTATHKLIANFSTAPFVQDPSQAWRSLTTPLPGHAATGPHPDFELYDLATDPHELENRFGDDALAEVRADLLSRLAGWMARTDDLLLTQRPLSPQHRRVRERLLAAV